MEWRIVHLVGVIGLIALALCIALWGWDNLSYNQTSTVQVGPDCVVVQSSENASVRVLWNNNTSSVWVFKASENGMMWTPDIINISQNEGNVTVTIRFVSMVAVLAICIGLLGAIIACILFGERLMEYIPDMQRESNSAKDLARADARDDRERADRRAAQQAEMMMQQMRAPVHEVYSVPGSRDEDITLATSFPPARVVGIPHGARLRSPRARGPRFPSQPRYDDEVPPGWNAPQNTSRVSQDAPRWARVGQTLGGAPDGR